MAHSHTNNVLVYVRMYAVTERGVVGRQVDCSILWLQRLKSSYCPEWSLSQWQRGSRTQQIGDVIGLAKTSQAHSQQPGTEAPVHAGTCRPSPPVIDNTLTNGKPVKFTQDGRDVIKLPGHLTAMPEFKTHRWLSLLMSGMMEEL